MWYKLKRIMMRPNGVEKQVRPNIPATSISLNQSSITLNTVGQTSQLTATLTPSDSTSTVTWSSSNTSIATVSQSWLVTCVTPWSCTITATTDNWLTANCNVLTYVTTTDTTVNSYNNTISNTNYFYWMAFTALKSWQIKEVWLLYTWFNWIIKLSQWAYVSATWTQYSVSTSWTTYTLSTPYQITAWNTYTVSFKNNSGSYFWMMTSQTFPMTRTAVRYDYGNNSTGTTKYYNVYGVKYLKIDYIP